MADSTYNDYRRHRRVEIRFFHKATGRRVMSLAYQVTVTPEMVPDVFDDDALNRRAVQIAKRRVNADISHTSEGREVIQNRGSYQLVVLPVRITDR